MAEPSVTTRRENGSTPDTDTYRALLRAAREVIRTRGYTRATVDEIRRAAGVSRATFYFYFQDKRQILIRLLNDTTQQYIDLYKRKYPGTDDYSRIVLTHIEYFAHFSRDVGIMRAVGVLASHDDAFREMVEVVRRGYRSRVQRQIARLIDSGVIRPTNTEVLALVLVGMVEQFTDDFFRLHRTEEEVRAHIAEAIQVLSETWYRALYVQEPPRPFPYAELLREVDVHGVP